MTAFGKPDSKDVDSVYAQLRLYRISAALAGAGPSTIPDVTVLYLFGFHISGYLRQVYLVADCDAFSADNVVRLVFHRDRIKYCYELTHIAHSWGASIMFQHAIFSFKHDDFRLIIDSVEDITSWKLPRRGRRPRPDTDDDRLSQIARFAEHKESKQAQRRRLNRRFRRCGSKKRLRLGKDSDDDDHEDEGNDDIGYESGHDGGGFGLSGIDGGNL